MSDTTSRSTELSISALNSKVKSRFHLYCLLSQKYKLPTFTSRAITTNYLKAYVLTPCPIFRILRTDFHPPFVVTRHVNATEIWKHIFGLLNRMGLPPLGLDEEKLLDFEWLVGVYFYLSPQMNTTFSQKPKRKKIQSQ